MTIGFVVLHQSSLKEIIFLINLCISKDDWRCDQYRWFNNGVTGLPKRNPIIKKHYFLTDTSYGPSKEFTRVAYMLCDSNMKVCVDPYRHHYCTKG